MPHDLPGWGVTGWSTQWAALDASEENHAGQGCGYGILKVVDPGVVYCEPPLVDGMALWAPVPGGRGRSFAMAWGEDDPPRYHALSDLHVGLAARRPGLTKEDEDLKQFDAAVLELVRLTAKLHKAGGTLGYLQPQSVLVCQRRDGATQVVLPDVGFFWDEEHGLREPKWIAEPTLDLLFEHGARRRNADCLRGYRAAAGLEMGKRAATQAAAQAEDVRLLARLIAVALAGEETVRSWCGPGRAFLGMPGRDKAPDTLAPIWDQVIAPALLGHVASCDDLAARLEAARPSEHFLFKPPAPPPLWKKALRRAAPAMAGIVAIFGAAAAAPFLYAWMFPPCNPHVLCRQVCASDPLYSQLDGLEIVRQQAIAKSDVTASAAYWDGLAGLQGMPESCRQELRKECAGLVDKAVRELVESLRRKPRPRSEELEMLSQAALLERRVTADLPGHESSSGGLLNRQIRLRGGNPASASTRPESANRLP
jgi:hypothetical protein